MSVSDRNGIITARYPDGQRYVGQAETGPARSTLEGDRIGVITMPGLDGCARFVAYSPTGVPSWACASASAWIARWPAPK